MSAIQGIRDWWQARDRREQWMLGAMFAMLGAFVLWYGVVTQLQRARATAQAHYDRAANDLIAVEANVREIEALLLRQPARPHGDAFARTVLDSAKAAGVPVSRQRTDIDGALTVGIDAVQASALFGWLDELRRQHGIAPQTITIAEANGRLRVELTFASADA